MIDELMMALVATLGVSTFVWFGVGLQGSFAVFWLVYFVTLSCGIVLAYLIASVAPNMVSPWARCAAAVCVRRVVCVCCGRAETAGLRCAGTAGASVPQLTAWSTTLLLRRRPPTQCSPPTW